MFVVLGIFSPKYPEHETYAKMLQLGGCIGAKPPPSPILSLLKKKKLWFTVEDSVSKGKGLSPSAPPSFNLPAPLSSLLNYTILGRKKS